jgi:hypothetical protein
MEGITSMTITTYAQTTSVPVEKSKMEIERLLTRYGASSFASGWNENEAVIQFEAHKKRIKFIVPLPPLDDYAKTPEGRVRRRPEIVRQAWEQGCRARWRALVLIVKAKLEAVQSGIATFEDEFGWYTILPNGKTVGELARPAIEESYRTGKMPPLLGMGSES